MSGLQRDIEVLRLVLATVPVVGQPPRGTPEQLARLEKLDPEAAERIREDAERYR